MYVFDTTTSTGCTEQAVQLKPVIMQSFEGSPTEVLISALECSKLQSHALLVHNAIVLHFWLVHMPISNAIRKLGVGIFGVLST